MRVRNGFFACRSTGLRAAVPSGDCQWQAARYAVGGEGGCDVVIAFYRYWIHRCAERVPLVWD